MTHGLNTFREKTPFSFSGFPVGQTICGHYTYGGKLVARHAFGAAQGPCGTLSERTRVLPIKPHHRG